MNFFRELWDALIYFLFPPRCPACKEIVDERHQFCAACYKKIFRVDFCKSVPAPLEKVLRVTKYRGGSQKLLHKLKFDNNLNVLKPLKKILDDVSDREEISRLLDGVSFVVPVPLHQKRFNERGFNQTEMIFREWFIKKNIPLKNLLIRVRETPKLYDKNKSERQEILSGVFAATEQIDLRGQKILIVDDIYTTGTTVSECAKVLKSLGAEKICVLAFASDFGEELPKT
ncbi:MAG: ComF family protein [Selenomonadaceae bacterium]|nr:ComF family protein [Selenomonadaceae bacterium]